MKKVIWLRNCDLYLAKASQFLIRLYQYSLAPHFPPTCRFLPTCSAYAYEAYGTWGFCKGSYLAVKRILVCHPFSKPCVDNVPKV